MKLKDVKSIGILGAGVMGGGIAQCAIQAGQKVIIRDLNDEILSQTKSTIIDSRFGFKKAFELGKMTQEQMDKAQRDETVELLGLVIEPMVVEFRTSYEAHSLELKDLKLDSALHFTNDREHRETCAGNRLEMKTEIVALVMEHENKIEDYLEKKEKDEKKIEELNSDLREKLEKINYSVDLPLESSAK